MREILAPCGGYESLEAALNAGADAVYVGMKRFSARKNAANFSGEELRAAALECHKRGVKMYAALNTLVYDRELPEFAECVKTAAEAGVDGLIVQDLGAAELAKHVCPDIPLHASTQMTLNSLCGVRAAERLGYSRVVIGRELSASEIKRISGESGVELEMFVHGALCVCVSGQCYMSSIFGGRSGNRGLCAQPCRLDFSYKDRHNIISLKDCSLIPHLNDIELSGVYSFKIEGRMKRPEYVACASDACRRTLSGLSYDKERLENIFSRGGLTESYYNGTMDDMQGVRGYDDVENSAKALGGIKELYKSEFPRIKVDISASIRGGEAIRAAAHCEYGSVEAVSETVPEPAKGVSIDEASVCSRLGKLGGTQFYGGNISATVDGGLYVSAAALNSLRRTLCMELENLVLEKTTPVYKIREFDFPKNHSEKRSGGCLLRAEIYSAEQLECVLKLDFELIYAPMGLLSENTADKDRIVVMPPLVLSGCEDETRERLIKLRKLGFSKGLAHTLGASELLRQAGLEIYGGYRMNILNSISAEVCKKLGFRDITLSIEGSEKSLLEISSPIPRGILAYGRIPLMLTRRCPIADGKPCGRVDAFGAGQNCGGEIVDRYGNRLPVLCGGNSVELLNPDVLVMSDKPDTLGGFDFAVLKFTVEKDEIPKIYDMYKNHKKPEGKHTGGLYFRGAE